MPSEPGPDCHRRGRLGAAAIGALAALLTTALVATVPTATAGPAVGARASAATSGPTSARARTIAIDTGSKASVVAAWRAQWQPATRARVALTSGSIADCAPFQTSTQTLRAMLGAINFGRGLSGVHPVTSLADPTRAAAQSALIQVANTMLTHTPSPASRCYTSAGARAAGRSNLGIWADSRSAWRPTVAAVVDGYLTDPGSSNKSAAHRIWLLRSAARHLAAGFATNRTGGFSWVSSDLMVFPNRADRPGGPKFHAWPAKGYFPIQLEPHGRWSLSTSRSGVSFGHARVKVTRNGHRVATSKVRASTHYGDNSAVWQLRKAPKKAGTYCVHLTHITGSSSHSYCVKLFRP